MIEKKGHLTDLQLVRAHDSSHLPDWLIMAIDRFVSDIQVVIADFITSNLDPHTNCNNLLNFLAIK